MLELEAFELKRAKPEIAVQYIDHNLLQTDYKNMDDHLFLQSAARFGFFSRPGNGISHVHMERFGRPKTLLGSDSHQQEAVSNVYWNGWFRCRLAAAGELIM
jgi:aconitate hydratase